MYLLKCSLKSPKPKLLSFGEILLPVKEVGEETGIMTPNLRKIPNCELGFSLER